MFNISFAQSLPFSKGVSLSNWFQTGNPHQIQFSKYSRTDLLNIKSLGADVIRLPINLEYMTDGSDNYIIDPLFFSFLDQVIDWCGGLGIYLILDNHTFDVNNSTPTNYNEVLVPIWKQMANHFKNRTMYVLYEILNEPHGISDTRWNEIQAEVVDSIRTIDTLHTIIVGPAGWNSFYNLELMPIYNDTNLIYTFHFYNPFIFTHQGAGWVIPSLVPLANLPFPYDPNRMPNLPPELLGSWIADEYYNYNNIGTIQHLHNLIDIAINFSLERNAPIFCGEFGVLRNNAPENDRVVWYNAVRQYFDANNIPWTSWDYQGGFGIFKKQTYELFDYNLNTPLLQALNFNIPPQFNFILTPDSSEFYIYRDYIENNIYSIIYSLGDVDFYSTESYNGDFSIHWSAAVQYENIAFDFIPDKDMNYLLRHNYVLSFWYRGTNNQINFDVRFVDTNIDENDHPWRMNYHLDNSSILLDGQWHKVEIPLTQFVEQGAWDNGWFPPVGLFDWTAIDQFQFVSENGNLIGDLYFDDIKIYDPTMVYVENENFVKHSLSFFKNYPNPFNASTRINFELSNNANVTLKIINILGKIIDAPINKNLTPGKYNIVWNGDKYASGVYFAILSVSETNGTTDLKTIKMSLVK